MCLAQGPQHSDAGEARTLCPSVSNRALSHCAPTILVLSILCDYGLFLICHQQGQGGTAETQSSKGWSESALFADIYHGIDKGLDN